MHRESAPKHRRHDVARHGRVGRGWVLVSLVLALLICGIGLAGFVRPGQPPPAVAAAAASPRASAAAPAPSVGAPQSPDPDPAKAAGTRFPHRLDARVATAIGIARRHHLRAAVSVLDTADGTLHSGGASTTTFATASTVKILIAAELIRSGRLHGTTAALARSMITRSDDDAANVLWPLAGGPGLEPSIEARYGVPGLGAPNTRDGLWGSTQVTAPGFARLLAALKHDPAVWPWLARTLRQSGRTAADGTDQDFGLRAADHAAGVKQGWATRSANRPNSSVIDTVGYVDHSRYVVVILTEGPTDAVDDTDHDRGFDPRQAAVTTAMAKALLR